MKNNDYELTQRVKIKNKKDKKSYKSLFISLMILFIAVGMVIVLIFSINIAKGN